MTVVTSLLPGRDCTFASLRTLETLNLTFALDHSAATGSNCNRIKLGLGPGSWYAGCVGRRSQISTVAILLVLVVLAPLVPLGQARAQVAPTDPAERLPGLKSHLNVQYGVDFFGLGVYRPALRASALDPLVTVRGVVSTRGGILVESGVVKRLGHSAWSTALTGSLSTMERNRFYGFGNSTDAGRPGSYYQLEQVQLRLAASVTWDLPGYGNYVTLGPLLEQLATEYEVEIGHGDDDADGDHDGGVVADLRPYGIGRFRKLGFGTAVGFGSAGPRSGVAAGMRFDAAARMYPAWLDLTSPVAVTTVSVKAFAVMPWALEPAVSVRLSAGRVFGDAPFHESVFLGGRRSLRGFQKQRYAGDLALALNSELRLNPLRLRVAGRPIESGPLALLDVGRVYVDGASPGGWHVGAGGGLWLRDNRSQRTVSAALVRSTEGLRAYVAVGFPFWP